MYIDIYISQVCSYFYYIDIYIPQVCYFTYNIDIYISQVCYCSYYIDAQRKILLLLSIYEINLDFKLKNIFDLKDRHIAEYKEAMNQMQKLELRTGITFFLRVSKALTR